MKESNAVKVEWNAIIASKLKDGIAIDDLIHEYPSGIFMEPNVMGADIENYSHIINVSQPWINMATIENGSSSKKNSLALLALQQGANGLNIVISNQDMISDILKDVLTTYLDVRVDCSSLSIEEIGIQKSLINENDFPNVRWVGQNEEFQQFFIGVGNKIEDVRKMLNKITSENQLDVVVTLSKNLLFEIASLRAIRALLNELPNDSFNLLSRYDIEGGNELGDYNLIEKTYKVISGVIGGSDAVLTTYLGDEDSRLSLNIHNVLDLESGMKNVLDPLGGSFYIEKLTGEIIRKVKEG